MTPAYTLGVLRRSVIMFAILSTLSTSAAFADGAYYLAFNETQLSTLDMRLAIGRLGESRAGASTGVVIDPMVTGRFAVEANKHKWNLTVLPEVGGSFWQTDHTRGNLFVAGMGLGWTRDYLVAGVVPSLVVGEYYRGSVGGKATGYRVTALFEILQIAGVQATYQKLDVNGKQAHQGMLTASLNLIPLYILARLSGG